MSAPEAKEPIRCGAERGEPALTPYGRVRAVCQRERGHEGTHAWTDNLGASATWPNDPAPAPAAADPEMTDEALVDALIEAQRSVSHIIGSAIGDDWAERAKPYQYERHAAKAALLARLQALRAGATDRARATGEGSKPETFVSASCGGERCTMCGAPAAAKLGEEIAFDDPMPHRHNLTAYVCAMHFDLVVRPYDRAAVADPLIAEARLRAAETARTWPSRHETSPRAGDADPERLNWMESTAYGTGKALALGGACYWSVALGRKRLGEGDDLRQAIDAAMAAARPPGEADRIAVCPECGSLPWGHHHDESGTVYRCRVHGGFRLSTATAAPGTAGGRAE